MDFITLLNFLQQGTENRESFDPMSKKNIDFRAALQEHDEEGNTINIVHPWPFMIRRVRADTCADLFTGMLFGFIQQANISCIH